MRCTISLTVLMKHLELTLHPSPSESSSLKVLMSSALRSVMLIKFSLTYMDFITMRRNGKNLKDGSLIDSILRAATTSLLREPKDTQ